MEGSQRQNQQSTITNFLGGAFPKPSRTILSMTSCGQGDTQDGAICASPTSTSTSTSISTSTSTPSSLPGGDHKAVNEQRHGNVMPAIMSKVPTTALTPKNILPKAIPTATTTSVTATSAEFMERKKNEIVQEMLGKVRPFVGPTGALHTEANFDEFARLMSEEVHFVQRTLLMTVLLSASEEVCERLAKCDRLVTMLHDWLAESIKMDTPLVGKCLDLLSKLPLSVDQLVTHRLGKLVKKIASSEGANNKDKASDLCELWTKLAKQEDLRRRRQGETILDDYIAKNSAVPLRSTIAPAVASTLAPASVTAATPFSSSSSTTASSTPTATTPAVVANFSLFSEAPTKTRAAQVLERAARGEGGGKVVSTRPLSADDIHRAKKRQLYLQEAATATATTTTTNKQISPLEKTTQHEEATSADPVPSNSTLSLDKQSTIVYADLQSPVPVTVDASPYPQIILPPPTSFPIASPTSTPTPTTTIPATAIAASISPPPSKKGKKKRVSFANEDSLVKVHIYETPEDDHRHDQVEQPSSDYHDIERDEASYAFKCLQQVMEADKDWHPPRPLSVFLSRGKESEERSNQMQRERTALSATYYSLEHVPPSPSEALFNHHLYDNGKLTSPSTIPLADSEGRVPVVLRLVSGPSKNTAITSGPLLHTVTSPPPLSTGTTIRRMPLTLSSPPTLPAPIISPIPTSNSTPTPTLSSLPVAVDPDLLSSLLGNPSALQDLLKNVNVAPSTSTSTSSNLGQPSLPLSFSGSLPFPPPPTPFAFLPPPSSSSVRPFPIRSICKYYKRGIPNSCRRGANCPYYHAD